MDLDKLENILADEKEYRLKQARRAIFIDYADDWEQVTVLPVDMRNKLNNECPLDLKHTSFISTDKKTVKVLLELADGYKIEAVLMRHQDNRNTVCVSSQVGCPVNCSFCATGQMGFKRNLTVSEIIDQVLFFGRILKKESATVTNVVFMGMGEPFLNYDNVIDALRILKSTDYFELGSRRLAVSTSGIIPGIEKFSQEEGQVNLAISLHAPNNELRTKLMPINKAYPIERLLKAVDNYIAKKNRRVMFEYLMIKGVNDSPEQAKQLIKIMNKPLYIVNLIKYNQTGTYYPADGDTISKFMKVLLDNGITVTQRYSFGGEIKAACGQLATQKNE